MRRNFYVSIYPITKEFIMKSKNLSPEATRFVRLGKELTGLNIPKRGASPERLGDGRNSIRRGIIDLILQDREVSMTEAWRAAVILFKGECYLCGKQLVDLTNKGARMADVAANEQQADHIVPPILGGCGTGGNLAPCCRECNNRKKDSAIDELDWVSNSTKKQIREFAKLFNYSPPTGSELKRVLDFVDAREDEIFRTLVHKIEAFHNTLIGISTELGVSFVNANNLTAMADSARLQLKTGGGVRDNAAAGKLAGIVKLLKGSGLNLKFVDLGELREVLLSGAPLYNAHSSCYYDFCKASKYLLMEAGLDKTVAESVLPSRRNARATVIGNALF
jgi:5-methylcytosine-specific restriction endonuclease McrA